MIKNEFGFEILSWCAYCKNPIYVGDHYDSDEEGMYCPGCKEQKNTYYDSLEVENE